MKNKLYIISHTHWDREWYMSFESHRARLVELMDALIEIMENEPSYKYFHLDGQTIVIEDYLEIKPFMKPRLDALIKDGRIKVGPWYVLQDETLISGEANIRNMLEGYRFCNSGSFRKCRFSGHGWRPGAGHQERRAHPYRAGSFGYPIP